MIYLLPGMGGASKMYHGPWRSLSGSLAVDWPEHDGEKSVEDVARRLIQEYEICSDDAIVGSSLGGVVALEIHRMIGMRHVVLVGSAISSDEINRLLVALAPLASVTPIRLIQTLVGKGPTAVSTMFADADAAFIRALCLAVSRWEGYAGDMKAVSRIHGRRDAIIHCPSDAHVIPGGGHLIAMTHADECVRIVNHIIC